MLNCVLIILISILPKHLKAGELKGSQKLTPEIKYTPLEFKQIFTEIPSTLVKTWDTTMTREALPYWGGILGSTALLYYYDEQILKASEQTGRDLGIGNKDGTKTFISINDFPILRLPTDTGSKMYFLGDGWMHMSIAWSFYFTGLAKDQVKTTNVGIQLFHGMAASTIINQVLKRATGRESPNTRTDYRGRWRPGPSFKSYWERTGEFDAMPSGHIMTATLVFTIIKNNYPDHDYWLTPLEYVWLSLLGFQMMNNGVHWASDYPIGIATGYVVGNIVSELGQTPIGQTTKKKDWMFFPSMDSDKLNLNFMARF